jgi:transcription antitermination factor NusG
MHTPASHSPSRTVTARAAKTSRQSFVTDIDPSAPLERGTRVRVLTGPFMGKIGVVQEVDGRGGARVMLGLLATRLDVKDLIASTEGRERPSLGTSHRKPLPGR